MCHHNSHISTPTRLFLLKIFKESSATELQPATLGSALKNTHLSDPYETAEKCGYNIKSLEYLHILNISHDLNRELNHLCHEYGEKKPLLEIIEQLEWFGIPPH
jgi:hypothetical protein